MDGARMQVLISKGYGIAAIRTGTLYAQYRPANPLAPLATVRATISAGFDAKASYRFNAPNEYGDARWYGLVDTGLVQAGDYLVGLGGTFFIAAVQPLLPAFCISCNATVSLLRVPANDSPGLQPYSGVYSDVEVALLSGWPASVLLGGRQSRGEAGLPGELALPAFSILLPAWPGVTVQPADVVRDAAGLRYNVQAAELSDLGWRITARLAGA